MFGPHRSDRYATGLKEYYTNKRASVFVCPHCAVFSTMEGGISLSRCLAVLAAVPAAVLEVLSP